MKLIPVVAQDARTKDVLMLAYADAEALRRTRRTGYMHYFSRSRNRLWKKGETSGHVQKVVRLRYDCDRDAILAEVEQTGPACHRGTPTCFARAAGRPPGGAVAELERVVADRRRRPRRGSYTNALLADPARLRGKLLEEACELAMASRGRRRDRVAEEAADLLYHTLVLLGSAGVSFEAVERVLAERRLGARPAAAQRLRRQR